MGLRPWLIYGAGAGLLAGILVDLMFDLPTVPLRVAQIVLVLFGAAVSAFVYEGSKLAAGGGEPARSTDPPAVRRRFAIRRRG
jgi:hypothetical protein